LKIRSVAEYFRADKGAVSQWRNAARETGLSKSEQDRMARAFEK